MTKHFQPARGTKDILPEEFRLHRYVTETALKIAECYGYEPMTPPVFEFTEVFKRTLGDTSDVVTKEMYSFEIKKDSEKESESLTLRPEFTAGIVRSFITNGLAHQVPLKFFSTGPLFRYERPQKGRYRQFHQINMECIGIASPLMDSEIIAMGAHILRRLGILEETVLQLNSLGDTATRLSYRTALVEYLSRYENDLSEESKVRLQKNPMRILDSKDQGDRKIVADAPSLHDHYSKEAKAFFEQVQEGLSLLGVQYTVNPQLVRGLDYYSHTAFEFVTESLGAQGTVMAGGRYDGLIGMMGGPETPAIGFAAGVERLTALLKNLPEKKRPIALIPIGETCEHAAFVLAHSLRQEGYHILLDFSGNTGKRMKNANKHQAVAAIFLGDDEMAKAVVKLRDLDSGEEKIIASNQLIDQLAHYAPRK